MNSEAVRSPSNRWAAVILAGGASTRMGRAKAELLWQGARFLDHWVAAFQDHCEMVLVVTGAVPLVMSPGATAIENSAWRTGQLSSLQAGLRQVPPGMDAVFFTPVDSPGVRSTVIGRMTAAWRGEALVVPRFEGQRGHPVGFAARLIPEFLGLDPTTQTARDIVRPYRSQTLYVDVEDEAILWDIDRPEDYEALLRRTT